MSTDEVFSLFFEAMREQSTRTLQDRFKKGRVSGEMKVPIGITEEKEDNVTHLT